MLDIKFVRENPEKIIASLKKRGYELNFDNFLTLEKQRLYFLREIEQKRAIRNSVSQDIAKLKKSGEDGQKVEELISEMRELGDEINNLENKLREIEEKVQIFYFLFRIFLMIQFH